MKRSSVVCAAALLLSACGGDGTGPGGSAVSFTFTTSNEGWFGDGADLEDPPVQWSVTHATDVGAAGPGAMRLHLENMNDAGKIWIERAFSVLPSQDYEVTIEFKLGTSDWGDVNLWRVIAGASAENPDLPAQLAFQDDTGNGAASDVGLRWVEKRYTVHARSRLDRLLWISIGVWGTFEAGRTYFIDDVRITLR